MSATDVTLYHGEPNGPSLSVLAALEESGCRPRSRRSFAPGPEINRWG